MAVNWIYLGCGLKQDIWAKYLGDFLAFLLIKEQTNDQENNQHISRQWK